LTLIEFIFFYIYSINYSRNDFVPINTNQIYLCIHTFENCTSSIVLKRSHIVTLAS
jgi:hypothetical protein